MSCTLYQMYYLSGGGGVIFLEPTGEFYHQMSGNNCEGGGNHVLATGRSSSGSGVRLVATTEDTEMVEEGTSCGGCGLTAQCQHDPEPGPCHTECTSGGGGDHEVLDKAARVRAAIRIADAGAIKQLIDGNASTIRFDPERRTIQVSTECSSEELSPVGD